MGMNTGCWKEGEMGPFLIPHSLYMCINVLKKKQCIAFPFFLQFSIEIEVSHIHLFLRHFYED